MAASPAEQLRDVRLPTEVDRQRPRLTSCAASCAIAARPTAPRQMRRFTATVLGHWGIGGVSEFEIREIVSELVSNAIEHSGTADVTLVLGFSSDSVRVCVKDSGRWRRPRAAVDEIAESGRGLRIVRAYSAQSGVRRSASGTTAWAVITAEPPIEDPPPS